MYVVKNTEKILGEINLEGSKNAALPIIVGACFSEEEVILQNIPIHLNDVSVLIDILNEIGFKISKIDSTTLLFSNQDVKELNYIVPEDGSKIRVSLLLLSLLLTKKHKIVVPNPGGCNIGERKYDIHLDSMRKMGAVITEDEYSINGEIEDELEGKDLTFHTATTTGTSNVIMAAVLAKGKTIIRNANTRPEVLDLINFLNSIGANITYKTRYIEINGVRSLSGGKYRIISGRDEAVTYMILAGMARGEVKIKNFNTRYCKTDTALLREIGLDIFEWNNDTYVSAVNKKLKPFSMATAPYPGINSDLQPLFAALAATIEGESIITDMRFNDRFQYVEEYKKFGVKISNYSNCAIVDGGFELSGAEVVAPDLRGGASLVLLGSIAKGITKITNEYQINRGYMNISSKLNALGAKIELVENKEIEFVRS